MTDNEFTIHQDVFNHNETDEQYFERRKRQLREKGPSGFHPDEVAMINLLSLIQEKQKP